MLTVVCWIWKGWRPVYTAERVNAFCRMFRDHCTLPHRIVCIAEEQYAKDITECDVYPLWPDWPHLPQIGKPNCYRRLRLFDSAFQQELGASRIWHWDIDCIIERNIDHMATEHPFRIAKGLTNTVYNGSTFLLDTGYLQNIWDDFDPVGSPLKLKKARTARGGRYVGSDQAWISYNLHKDNIPTYGPDDGLWFFTRYGRHHQCTVKPAVWFFAGGNKPWHSHPRKLAPALYKHYMSYVQQ